VANEEFTEPRLARIYDQLDADRRDLDLYLSLAQRFDATKALDIGCGTGVLALLLANDGIDVVAVDPAAASLQVARSKPGADRVTWLLGEVNAYQGVDRDLVVMTGNTAQQFTENDQWRGLLKRAHAALVPGGRLVFESRDPDAREWETWTRGGTLSSVDPEGVGEVSTWTEVITFSPPLLTFRRTWSFAADDSTLTSDSTLRFRSAEELLNDLSATGFTSVEILDAPDRPGRELVFVAQRSNAR
jgi:SAM-dependent methyltransferase